VHRAGRGQRRSLLDFLSTLRIETPTETRVELHSHRVTEIEDPILKPIMRLEERCKKQRAMHHMQVRFELFRIVSNCFELFRMVSNCFEFNSRRPCRRPS
jgi:hypothetical protein